jgi:hypothetical protein
MTFASRFPIVCFAVAVAPTTTPALSAAPSIATETLVLAIASDTGKKTKAREQHNNTKERGCTLVVAENIDLYAMGSSCSVYRLIIDCGLGRSVLRLAK